LLPSFVNLLATVMQVTAERHCLSNTGLGLAFLPYHFPYLSRAVGKEASLACHRQSKQRSKPFPRGKAKEGLLCL